MTKTEEVMDRAMEGDDPTACRLARMLQVADKALWSCIVLEKEPHAKRVCGDAMLEMERIAGE